ncbi:monocarboxylate transporter 2-like isoform X1 [Argiope bruennichi]|uniref:monocarboxylate transporter 2-like isoform X1 n=1 Tax=Argiope bruennichi TaxID=94029 RepID=UPI00249588FA|nr:monocarboxylate transporter 2-like isoform X1 [Argiope bruennichi]XP_055953689.1 monocarboxylate transporter 2-like isoform X1 [Argiope bruennichi]XP_055953691.1 monocarboxylate transporter 2-like isoform X1 [Argiope bruennichi]
MKFSASDIESGIAVVSCTFIYGALVATPFLSSLMFVASMSKFNIDKEHASLPFLLCYTIKNAFGPVIGFLGSIFGLKKIILFGSFLSSAAIGACFFAEDMVTITILWGVAFGFSFGLGVSFLPQVLSMHFSKHLDKSIGIIVGGECIVSFFLTLLTDYSLKSYGLSGTFLILSCVVLHSVPAAMLIRKPKNVEKSERLIEKLT